MEAPATGALGSIGVPMRARRTWRWHRMIDYLLPRRRDGGLHFWTNRGSKRAREVIVRPPRSPLARLGAGGGFGGEQRRVTPRQTCPRPDGFGRNLRSKTRWFTGFCNSHQVSHFATFFIDARAEISVAESRSLYSKPIPKRPPRQSHRLRGLDGGDRLVVFP